MFYLDRMNEHEKQEFFEFSVKYLYEEATRFVVAFWELNKFPYNHDGCLHIRAIAAEIFSKHFEDNGMYLLDISPGIRKEVRDKVHIIFMFPHFSGGGLKRKSHAWIVLLFRNMIRHTVHIVLPLLDLEKDECMTNILSSSFLF